MAAGLGYIEFATGDILTAAAANGYLASQTVMVFADSAARSAAITSPQEGMFSYLKDTNATQYYSGSAWTSLGGGSSGKILQVVQATYSTQVNVSTNTPTDTGLSVTITPSATSSRIFIIANHAGLGKDTGNTSGFIDLVRSGTKLFTMGSLIGNNAGSGTNIPGNATISYVDSPSSTSALTYKTQLWSGDNLAKVFINAGAPLSTIIAMEIGA